MLARIEGAPAGVKGISLFVAPKFLPGTGARNGVSCGSIEHKMGIHGNSTCVMNYDGAQGWLVGAENRGLNAMFVMMNGARLGVAVQGLAQSEVAYQNAAAYAKERLQGRSLTGAKSPDKPADSILVHPDVRRMLLEVRAFNEAARALMVSVALSEDEALGSPDEKARQAAEDRIGLLTPVIKGVFTDVGFANAVKAQQVLGGHGYIAEWGMEQFVRDARIAMIYEGANGIQALDLVGRKLPKDGGRALTAFFAEVNGFIGDNKEDEALAPYLGAAEGRARPVAAGDDVADAERDEEPRQRRRRLDRLHAPVRPRRALLYVGADRQGGAEAAGRGNQQPGARRQAAARAFLQRARAAGKRGASRPHRQRRRAADEPGGGGVLKRGERHGREQTDRRMPLRRGALRARGAPTGASICHCRMCQQAGGGPLWPSRRSRRSDFAFTAARRRSIAAPISPSAASAPSAARR